MAEQSDRKSMKEAGRLPAVLMFQPTDFEVVAGDRLREWETMLRDSVGLRVGGGLTGDMTPTISFCGPQSFADDCDSD